MMEELLLSEIKSNPMVEAEKPKRQSSARRKTLNTARPIYNR